MKLSLTKMIHNLQPKKSGNIYDIAKTVAEPRRGTEDPHAAQSNCFQFHAIFRK